MPPKQQTVLCVDDDPDDQMMVCEKIKEINPAIDVHIAHNGLEALSYLEEAKKTEALPCLIILDINMPLLDGKQTVVRIKNDGTLQSLPLVMFSTSSSLIDKAFCDKHEVEFITKPGNFRDLTTIVKRILAYCAG